MIILNNNLIKCNMSISTLYMFLIKCLDIDVNRRYIVIYVILLTIVSKTFFLEFLTKRYCLKSRIF